MEDLEVSQRISNRRKILAKLIETKTILVESEDFNFVNVVYAHKTRKKPDEWIIIQFKESRILLEDKKNELIKIFNELQILFQDEKRFYVRLPYLKPRILELVSPGVITELKQAEDFDEWKSNLLFIKNIHRKTKLLGVACKVQNLEICKTGRFIYYDSPEASRSEKFCTAVGLSVKKVSGDSHALDFDLKALNPDSINLLKAKIEDRELSLDICVWIINEVCEKLVKRTSVKNLLEISCSEVEATRIKMEVEGYGFQVNLSKEKNGTFYADIKFDNSQIQKQRKMEDETKKDSLLQVLKEKFRAAKLPLLQDQKKSEKLACLQLKRKGENQVVVFANYGTPQQKKEVIAKMVKVIMQFFPEAKTEIPGMAATRAIVWIPGFTNGPERKKKEKKIVDVKPTEVISGLTTTNEILPVFDAILSGRPLEYSEEELQLKKLIDDPESFKMLAPEVVSEIHNYFLRKRVNEHAKFLLAKLQNKS